MIFCNIEAGFRKAFACIIIHMEISGKKTVLIFSVGFISLALNLVGLIDTRWAVFMKFFETGLFTGCAKPFKMAKVCRSELHYPFGGNFVNFRNV